MSVGETKAAAGFNLRQEISGLFSLLLFLCVTALLFRSWEFALIVTASLGFHELGHVAVLIWFRLDYRIFFGVIGAGTWSNLKERMRLSQLGNIYIHLAGPLFSLVLALMALALHALWQPVSQHLLILANFSAQIGFLNLLPLGRVTDGGKAAQRVTQSLSGKPGWWPILLLISAAVLIPLVFLLIETTRAGSWLLEEQPVHLYGILLIGVWLAASYLGESRRVGRPAPGKPRPLTTLQAVFTTVLIWDMLAVLSLVILHTPFWLAPEYVLGSLKNVELMLGLIVQLVTAIAGS
jgi:hypothetical protein